MRIWLNQIDGTSQHLDISQACTFDALLQLHNLTQMRLVCQGVHVDAGNFKELLVDNSNVYVTGDLDGGKKKKKKKVYTTKKKNKHIHKRVKLSIYTLYGIDGTSSLI